MLNRFHNDDSLRDGGDLFRSLDPTKKRQRNPMKAQALPQIRWEQIVRRKEPSVTRPALEQVEEEFLRCEMIQMIDEASPLAARCHHEPKIRLLVDGNGRLHLWHSSIETNVQRGIVSLIQARFWACDNIELIALTEPHCYFNHACEPALHLFTTKSQVAASFQGKLGRCLTIHLV